MLKTFHNKLLVHKLILKNLQNQLLTLLVLSTVLPVSAVGLYGINSSSNALTDLSVNQVEKDVSDQALRIEQFLNGVYGDVRLLSKVPPIQGIIRARENGGVDRGESSADTYTDYRDWVKRAETIFRATMSAKPQYQSMRYVDENNRELVRLDAIAGTARVRTNPYIQGSKASLFGDGLNPEANLQEGQIYTTPVVIERDANHPLGQSVIHYYTPIFNSQGRYRGLVIATVFVDSLTVPLRVINADYQRKALLLTKEGRYLVHPYADKVWRSRYQPNSLIQNDYASGMTEQILSEPRGSIHQGLEKIISYRVVNFGKAHEMIVVYDIPKYLVFQSVSTFKRIALGVVLLSLGTVLAIGVSIVRKISRSQTMLYEQAQAAAMTAEAKAKELENTLNELHRTQTQLVQTEKMSSLGQLVAGVAHEINNPVNFIYGNLKHVDSYTHDMLGLIQLYQQHFPNPGEAIASEAAEIDIEFLMADMPKMLDSMKVGADRIRQIVLSLRNFSRLDEAEMKAVNIHDGIDSTLLILQNRLKARGSFPGIEVEKEYGNLPPVECFPGQLNQVLMNLLSNAIDALEEKVETDGMSDRVDEPVSSTDGQPPTCKLPQITIRTELLSPNIRISILDNGTGMPAKVRDRLFEPFFTTKPIGKGTGLGLSISYQIVTEKHGGTLQCFSEIGKGTEFRIEIPIYQKRSTSPIASKVPEPVSAGLS